MYLSDLQSLAADLPPITLLSFGCRGGDGKGAMRILEDLNAAGADVRLLTLQGPSSLNENIMETPRDFNANLIVVYKKRKG
ncbi:hypothetical protein FACS189468_7760 [Spirochaetia bacterium]|nr:hypothetical protein FACS189468_7760 [Spirochaetia bacterium]